MKIILPRNISGWESIWALCRRVGVSFEWSAPVEVGGPCWKTRL